MKLIIAAALISFSAVTASAGNISYIAPDSVTIEIEPNMNIGSGSWIIPAVIVAILAIALSQSEPTEEQ